MLTHPEVRDDRHTGLPQVAGGRRPQHASDQDGPTPSPDALPQQVTPVPVHVLEMEDRPMRRWRPSEPYRRKFYTATEGYNHTRR